MLGFKREQSIVKKAREADKVLFALGIESHTESGKQIRSALAMELLGQKYGIIDKHGKATFVKQHSEVLGAVRQMLIEDGVLTNPGTQPKQIESKEVKKKK